MSKSSASAPFQESVSYTCALTFQPAQDTGMGPEGAAPSAPSPALPRGTADLEPRQHRH